MSRRQKASAKRRAAFWAGKEKAARTPEDRAVVAWDRLRSAIRDLPEEQEAQAWAEAAKRLDSVRLAVTDSEFTSAGSHRAAA